MPIPASQIVWSHILLRQEDFQSWDAYIVDTQGNEEYFADDSSLDNLILQVKPYADIHDIEDIRLELAE